MPKLKIYLDTSVPSAYGDSRQPIRQMDTQAFWQRLDAYEVFVSNVVNEEINQTPILARRDEMLDLVKPFQNLQETPESEALSDEYLNAGFIRVVNDGRHLAVASVYRLDVLVSWNYRDLVKLSTKLAVNALNTSKGYPALEIVDPLML